MIYVWVLDSSLLGYSSHDPVSPDYEFVGMWIVLSTQLVSFPSSYPQKDPQKIPRVIHCFLALSLPRTGILVPL